MPANEEPDLVAQGRVKVRELLLEGADKLGNRTNTMRHFSALEDFYRAAFDLLSDDQVQQFWQDERVSGLVQPNPECFGILATSYKVTKPAE